MKQFWHYRKWETVATDGICQQRRVFSWRTKKAARQLELPYFGHLGAWKTCVWITSPVVLDEGFSLRTKGDLCMA
jgi:hypothetical protein